MHLRTQKTSEKASRSLANTSLEKNTSDSPALQFNDNRPIAVAQRKLQEMANSYAAKSNPILQLKRESSTTNAKTIQLFTEEDVKFMHGQKMGLRHHGDHLKARFERLTGTSGGDAVPLNPLGANPKLAYPLMGIGAIPPEAITQFTANVGTFISQSLERTIKIELGVTTPRQIAEEARGKSTFLIVSGMKGTDIPRDVEKPDYAGLGKAGKQEIKPDQITALMNFDDVSAEAMKLFHEERWNLPIETREQGDEIFHDLVLIYVEKLRDAVHKLRTGRERFMKDE